MEAVVRTPSLLHPFTPLLACADTNAAVDNLVDGLVRRGIDVVRLGQPAKVHALHLLNQVADMCDMYCHACRSSLLACMHVQSSGASAVTFSASGITIIIFVVRVHQFF